MTGIGFTSVTCTDATGGGCNCTATIQQTGGIGVLTSDPQTSGNYTTSNNVVTADDSANYSYCVSGSTMTWTPQTTNPGTTGTIVRQKNGGPGAGGAAGSGGRTGSGGTTGGGGVTSKGGATGSGGATASGGATGSGGATAKGGATGSGGATASGGATGTGGATGAGGSTSRGDGPCDIYAAASPATPCAAAYSMVRALSKTYSGPLYQVRNGSSSSNTGTGGTTKDIGMLADGYADAASQDAFCTSTCTVSLLYDQSGNANNLKTGTKGTTSGGTYSATDDFESSATKGSVTAGGHKVYVLYMAAREGYRSPLGVKAKGVPQGNTAQGIYELADGTHVGTACCWDFGSVSPDPTTYVTMNTLFFGTGFWGTGAGSGPWFGGDFEGGVWMGGSSSTPGGNSSNPSLKVSFALGILHTPVGKYALRMADVSTASDLTNAYDGAIPSGKTWGNAGGIVLGVGGDNSNNSWGTFYEGAMTSGAPSNDTDLAVMKNIQAVGYKK